MNNGFVHEFGLGYNPVSESEEVPIGIDEAVKICSLLVQHGAKCSEILQRDHYGWDFLATFQGRRFLVVLQEVNGLWSLSAAQCGFTNFLTAKRKMNESLNEFEVLNRTIIEELFHTKAIKTCWGFFGFTI